MKNNFIIGGFSTLLAAALFILSGAGSRLNAQTGNVQIMRISQVIDAATAPAQLEGVRAHIAYFLPPGSGMRFLNIYAQLPGQNNYALVAMNVCLDTFSNTRQVNRSLPLQQLGVPTSARIPLLNLYAQVTNNPIFTPINPPFFQTYQCPLDSTFMFDDMVSDPPAALGPDHILANFAGPLVANKLRGCKVPNVDLDNGRHPARAGYGGDRNACGPASVANSLSWIQGDDPRVGVDGLDERERLEELSGLMGRGRNGTVTPAQIIQGKIAFIAKYGLKLKVEYRGFSGNYDDDIKWLDDQYKAGQDIEMDYTYVKDGVTLGHIVVITDLKIVGGVVQVSFKDDENQKGAGGMAETTVPFRKSADGHITFVRDNKVCTVNNMYAESYDENAGTYTDPKSNTTGTKFCQKDKNQCDGACPALVMFFDQNQMPVTTYPVCDKHACCDIRKLYTSASGTCMEKKGNCKGQCAPLYRNKKDAELRRNAIRGDCDKGCICVYDLTGKKNNREIPAYEPVAGQLKIYPNPAGQQINIVVIGYEGTYKLQLVNVLGQQLISKSIELNGQEVYTLDVSALAKGVYYVVLSSDEKVGGIFVKE